MKFRPKIEKIIKKNKKMSSPHNFVDFDDENHNIILFKTKTVLVSVTACCKTTSCFV